MSTKFFTNEGENTLIRKFKGIFEHNKNIEIFDALVGYFRASGYFKIRPFLENVPRIRILVGINVDKILAHYQSKGLLFKGDANQTLLEFLAEIKSDIQKADYTKEVESGIIQFVEDVASGRIEVKAHPHRKLHAKIYIFKPKDWNEHNSGFVITGSSNLTEAALGGTDDSNYEFNVILRDHEDLMFASEEFDKLWREGVAILPVDIEKVKKGTYINDEFTPFEVYMKFLMEYFGKSVEFDPNSISDLPSGFKRLSYQVDAVNLGYRLLQKHNGFFLSDVVGLGKTVVGTLIAKKFFYSNRFPGHISTILIIVPPALKQNWVETLEQFGLKNYEITTNGSIHKISNPEKYDLIIVDEAHKFRNDSAEAYNELQKLCKTKSKRQLPDGSFVEKKVILISATPLNNRPQDIASQIYLFQDSKDSTLEVSNLQNFFRKKIDAYEKLKNHPDIAEVQRQVKEIYKDIREKVISPLTIRRTRSDLKEHELYSKDLIEQDIRFPDVEKPQKIFYQLSPELDELYDSTIKFISSSDVGLKYYRYQALKFLKPHKKAKYKTADIASNALAGIMKTLLVKRIDSSFHAFKTSMKRFANANQVMIQMFNNGKIYIAPNININEYILEDREDELLDRITTEKLTDPTIDICEAGDFEESFFLGLLHDQTILDDLNQRWDNVTEDPKLEEFLNKLKNELLLPTINPQRKLVVFSESAETTSYLIENLKKAGYEDAIGIDASSLKNNKENIRKNFDANINRTEYRSDINILISTEVLAEGVNLHRSNVVVNYDTPWNSTRLMQRIGRVNRIGSTADKVYIYNFYPTAKVNNDIELEKKAIMKLQAFHSALGEDSEIYSPDEETQSFGLFEKDVDEDKDERLVFLMELRKFKRENEEAFRKIKNMPLRARTGRKDTFKKDSTLCFIRNNRRDVFYWIQKGNQLDEISFVDAANAFRADPPEHSIPLHNYHHEQVQTALQDFHAKLQDEITKDMAVDITMGPNEKRAIAYLDGFLSFPFIGEEEKLKIKTAKQAIKIGKFQKLQREVNALKKNTKTTRISATQLLDAIVDIINRYPIDINDHTDNRPMVTIKAFDKYQPDIIISESFDKPA